MPTSYNHLTEIDEQNNEEEYRSLSLVEEAEKLENQDENLKLVLPILKK